MKQVNINEFYQFGSILHPISELQPGRPLKEYHFVLIWGRLWLGKFVQDRLIPMTICKGAAWKTINAINELFPPGKEESEKIDMEREVTYSDLYSIQDGVREFETVFSAEVQNMALYFVSKKAIYDTNDLIAHADNLFPENVQKQMGNQSRQDIKEAGKCLAFDLATAAGFHITRAVEGVLIDYLKLLNAQAVTELKDAQRNLGNYIKLAREQKGEEKVCNSLDQFRDLHRNPLIHPETVLTMDEAITLLGIAQSTIVGMAYEIAKHRTPSAASLLMGGDS